METVLPVVFPVFSIVALGWWLGGHRRLELQTLSDLTLLVASPALLFSLLAGTPLELGRMLHLAGGAFWIAGGTAALAFLYARVAGLGRGFVLPSVFFNGGNMGLACARLAFGSEGLESAAIVFVTIAMLTSIFGVWVAKGRGGFGEALRMPLLHGSLAGLAVTLTGTEVPRLVMEPVEMLGSMAIPLMLVNLGLQLRALRVRDVRHSIAAVGIRMGGGIAFAGLYVAMLGIGGVDRQVLLLDGVMPAAVMNALLAQRYAADPALVASAVVLGTLVSVIAIPLVLLALSA